MENEEPETPYRLGWAHAFDWCSERKEHPPCPFPEGSSERKEYDAGYDEGIAMYEVM